MAKTVEIPDELHEQLEARARREGVTVSEYIASQLERDAVRESASPELLERIRRRPPVDLEVPASELIREGREERARQLTEPWSSSTPQR